MGLVSRLKKLKLKKLQPGKLVKGVVAVAASAGVPGASAAEKIVNRVGQRVDDFNRTKERVQAQLKEVAKNSGLPSMSTVPMSEPRPFPGASVGETELAGAGASLPGSGSGVLILVALVAVVFLMRK